MTKLSLRFVMSSVAALSVLAGCSSSGGTSPAPASSGSTAGSGERQSPGSGSTAAPAPAASGSGAEPADSCNWTTGTFTCGSRSCAKDTDFCDLADAQLGAACKSIGGDGSTCPRCATVLSFYACENGLTPSCRGDETTGVTVECQ